MWVLDEILKEIDQKIKDAGKIMVETPRDELDRVANDTAEAFIMAYEECEDIVRKYLCCENGSEIEKSSRDNDWISIEERSPKVPNNLNEEDCPEFNVMIKDAKIATTLKYASDGTWFDDLGNTYYVIAWMPLPEPYRPDSKGIVRAVRQGFVEGMLNPLHVKEMQEWKERMLQNFMKKGER